MDIQKLMEDMGKKQELKGLTYQERCIKRKEVLLSELAFIDKALEMIAANPVIQDFINLTEDAVPQ